MVIHAPATSSPFKSVAADLRMPGIRGFQAGRKWPDGLERRYRRARTGAQVQGHASIAGGMGSGNQNKFSYRQTTWGLSPLMVPTARRDPRIHGADALDAPAVLGARGTPDAPAAPMVDSIQQRCGSRSRLDRSRSPFAPAPPRDGIAANVHVDCQPGRSALLDGAGLPALVHLS
jgi:hypothetical protein